MGTKQTTGAPIFLFYLCVSIGVGNTTWRRSTWPGLWHNLMGQINHCPFTSPPSSIDIETNAATPWVPHWSPIKAVSWLNFASLRSSNGNWWLQTKPATSFLFGPPVLRSSFNEDKDKLAVRPHRVLMPLSTFFLEHNSRNKRFFSSSFFYLTSYSSEITIFSLKPLTMTLLSFINKWKNTNFSILRWLTYWYCYHWYFCK